MKCIAETKQHCYFCVAAFLHSIPLSTVFSANIRFTPVPNVINLKFLNFSEAAKAVEASMKLASKKNPLESQYADLAEELD